MPCYAVDGAEILLFVGIEIDKSQLAYYIYKNPEATDDSKLFEHFRRQSRYTLDVDTYYTGIDQYDVPERAFAVYEHIPVDDGQVDWESIPKLIKKAKESWDISDLKEAFDIPEEDLYITKDDINVYNIIRWIY